LEQEFYSLFALDFFDLRQEPDSTEIPRNVFGQTDWTLELSPLERELVLYLGMELEMELEIAHSSGDWGLLYL
jgi:hypothetical protein